MNWGRIFSRSFLLAFIVFLLFAIIAISTPFWIPKWIPKYAEFTQDTGYIGDTFGGVTSPFITLVMAILAFSAFWMQYQTLRDQRQEMNRQHFEERLSLMLSQQRENANSLKAGAIKGRESFAELAGEYYLTQTLVSTIVETNLLGDIRNVTTLSDEQKANLVLYFNEIIKNPINKQDFIIRTAYGIFFQGLNYTPNASINEERVWLTDLIKTRLRQESFSINPLGSPLYSSILFSDSKDLSGFRSFPYQPFMGHNAEMGCYYRHLYQLIRLIACSPGNEMTELEKYGYAKLVRSFLSDYEQFLLYYNSLSDFGDSWNRPFDKDSKNALLRMGLIARFRMIKNLPSNIIWRGLSPIDKYKSEINEWRQKQCDFFETKQFLTIDD